MSGIGFWELIILSLIGLIVLGPERLPKVANQLGTWLGQARRMTRVMKRQLEEELNFENDLTIKPPGREPSTQPTYTPPRKDDEHSEAHDAGEPGTGVGDDKEYADDDELEATSAGDKKESASTDGSAPADEARTKKKPAKEAT